MRVGGTASESANAVAGRPTSAGQGIAALASNDCRQYTDLRNVFKGFFAPFCGCFRMRPTAQVATDAGTIYSRLNILLGAS
jgi:hypothetical protein